MSIGNPITDTSKVGVGITKIMKNIERYGVMRSQSHIRFHSRVITAF